MLIERKQIFFMALPFVAIILSTMISSFVKYKQSLSPSEHNLSRFSYEMIQIVQQQLRVVAALRKSREIPVVIQRDFTLISPQESLQLSSLDGIKISLILITSGGRKMAIVNDIIVNEGDLIDNRRVAKIEHDRILLQDEKGKEWIKTE